MFREMLTVLKRKELTEPINAFILNCNYYGYIFIKLLSKLSSVRLVIFHEHVLRPVKCPLPNEHWNKLCSWVGFQSLCNKKGGALRDEFSIHSCSSLTCQIVYCTVLWKF
jgi:hypothetical protein